MQARRVALVLGAWMVMAWPALGQTPPPAPAAPAVWQPKTQAEFEAAVAGAVKNVLAQSQPTPAQLSAKRDELKQDVKVGATSVMPTILSSEDAFRQTLHDQVVRAAATVEIERRKVVVLPTGDCGRYVIEPAALVANDPTGGKIRNIEQRVTRDLACCLDDPVHAKRMACIHRNVGWLSYAHSKQARAGQKWFFGESAFAATAAVGGVIDTLNGISSATAEAWGVLAFAPVIIEELGAAGPRSQIHYAATHAFTKLASHYRTLDRHFGAFPTYLQEAKVGDLFRDCQAVSKQKAIDDKQRKADSAIFNGDVERFKAYCKDFTETFIATRSYRTNMMVAYNDMAEKYADDALAIEGIFHKMSFKLQTPPSKALQVAAAAPFQTIANALKDQKPFDEYKAQEVTFNLEKDGIPLSGTWPVATLPKAFPLIGATRTDNGATSEGELLKGDSSVDVKAASETMKRIAEASASETVLQSHDLMNQTIVSLADQVGTYKMVFDMRAEKRTADIEFTRLVDKK